MQKRFLQNVMLFMIKGFFPLRTVEFIWFQILAFSLCPKVSFLSRKVFIEYVFFTLMNMTCIGFVQLARTKCLTTTCTINLQMSKGAHDEFVIIVNFMSTTWEPKHITIGEFEAIVTNGVAIVMKLKQILDKFGITQKTLAYVKNKGSNL